MKGKNIGNKSRKYRSWFSRKLALREMAMRKFEIIVGHEFPKFRSGVELKLNLTPSLK